MQREKKNPPYLQLFDAIHEFFITRMNHTRILFIYLIKLTNGFAIVTIVCVCAIGWKNEHNDFRKFTNL